MGLLGIPSLIAGLILALAGSSWFPGASTVGTILIVVSLVLIVLWVVIVLVAANAARGKTWH